MKRLFKRVLAAYIASVARLPYPAVWMA